MQKRLLTRILKGKSTKNKTVEEIIDEFIASSGEEAKIQSESFLSDLLFLILSETNIPKDELLKIVKTKLKSFSFKTTTEGLEEIYSAFAVSAMPKVEFIFDKVDTKAIESMYQNFIWIGDNASDNLQKEVRESIKEAFEGELSVKDIGDRLREKFGAITKESEDYFQGVSDHILRQSQSIARVKQYEKNGVKYVMIDAVMDSRTSQICRSMNGRVIEIKHLSNQADNILSAKDIEAKKSASQWQSAPYLGTNKKLPSSLGLPPYHFRCRTAVKPHYTYEKEIDGVKAKGSLLPKDKYKGDEVVLSHIDKTGKEIVVVKENYEHISRDKHLVPKKDIIKALNSIEQLEKHIDGRSYSVKTANGYYMSFDGNTIKTMFKPTIGVDKYFKKHIKLKDGERNIIKWLKEFLS